MAAKKRAQISGQEFAGSNLFAKTTDETKETKSALEQKRRREWRATYDLTPELKERIVRKATDLGISTSQLALFMLSDALDRLDRGAIDPTPFITRSDSPKFRNNLPLGDWYWLKDDAG